VTHEEDSEPLLADTKSDSSDDGVAVPKKLCDDDESDKSSDVSKEDDDEEEEKEDDEEEEEKEDDEEEEEKEDDEQEEEKEYEVEDDKEDEEDHRKETMISMETQTMTMKTMMGKGNMRMMVGGQMMSSMDARTKATLRGAMMLMKTAIRNVKEATYPTMMMTWASMRDHNSMQVQQMMTCQLMKEQHASTTSAPAVC
jgi:hypothetical protein